MTEDDLLQLVEHTVNAKQETQTLEVKKAGMNCPTKLYDTLSSFSNQDEGGTILFGLDEENKFEPVGVYNPSALQDRICEQCEQMSPVVRPVVTIASKNGKSYVSCEVPGIPYGRRPCYNKARGIVNGSYIRMGSFDKRMSQQEIFDYEVFRSKDYPECQAVPEKAARLIQPDLVEKYVASYKHGKPQVQNLSDEAILEFSSLYTEGSPTLAALLLLGVEPQFIFPQLGIKAVSYPGLTRDSETDTGSRFLDNRSITGSISNMVDESLEFFRKNLRTETYIHPDTGKRNDRLEIPVLVLREAILNALLHRDYGLYSETLPIDLQIFPDRVEIISPGGLFGGMRLENLGKRRCFVRNPALIDAAEILEITENRFSGIPNIYKAMKEAGLRPPEFQSYDGVFKLILRRGKKEKEAAVQKIPLTEQEQKLLAFCRSPRTRKEIANFLDKKSTTQVIRQYIVPLIEKGWIALTVPDQFSSRHQKFYLSEEGLAKLEAS